MAAPKKNEKGAKGGVKRRPASKRSTCYEISGDGLKRKNKHCPKCGPGVFMAAHKDRVQCGKCGYMEKKTQ